MSEKIDLQLTGTLKQLNQDFANFTNKILKDEENNQRSWIEQQFKITQSMNIIFECCISKQKVQMPVSFTQCINKKKHFDEYFDFEQLIVYLGILNGKTDNIQCPSCKDQIKFQQKSSLLQIIQEIIRPHVFFYKLRKQVGIYPKDIIYYHRQNLIIPFYKAKYQTYFNQQYHSEEYGIERILLQPPQQENQFFSIANKLNDYNGCDFVNVCLISQVRVNIPVRGNQCVHYESYDLIALHKHLFESESKMMNCTMEGCKSVFVLKDPKTFQIDFQLLQAGREGLSFSINFIYLPHIQKLSELLYHRQRDEFIIAYREAKSLELNLEYLNKIYEIAEQIFVNNENNKKQTELFQKLPNIKISDDDDLVICPITNFGIELPARCRNCKGLQVTDLRYLVCILNQAKNEKDIEGVKKVQKACPLCNSPFLAQIKPPSKFIDQIYIDVKLMKFFLQAPFYQRTVKDYKQYLMKQQQQETQETNAQVSLQIFDKLESKSWEQGKLIFMYKLSLYCILTNKRIKIPVRNIKCTNHYDCFDKDALKQFQQEKGTLEKICCPKCQAKFESCSNFYIDLELNEMFSKQEKDLSQTNSNFALVQIGSKKLTPG
ncbi:unnamed protein product [Paramecium sonneborni]|uniref:SP-RING-type domain-containing protein n=1 Tax=Paramecium sonneborni TaxID=65129 RepID=A0A8S1LX90_9CILI|nr:unnamed protein product [Paramecium sonneborni]